MKKIIFILGVAISMSLFYSCSKNQTTEPSFIGQTLPLSNVKIAIDSTVYNHDQVGKFFYEHMKYYLGTVDALQFLPKDQREGFSKKFEAYKQKIAGWTHDQTIDDLVASKVFSLKQGEILKNNQKLLTEYLTTKQPSKDEVWNWLLVKEDETINNIRLSPQERSQLLIQQSIIRYALKQKYEQTDPKVIQAARVSSGKTSSDCTFWSVLACWVGNIATAAGAGTGIGAIVGGADGSVVGAAIGAGVGAIQSIVTCGCSVDKDVCQAPSSVSLPYRCYTPGQSLTFTAVGYGNVTPSQFTFYFKYNDNVNNSLWTNFTNNNYIDLPGDYITNNNVSDVAVQVGVRCPGQNSDYNSIYYGWFNLANLGKPYFTISGRNNLTVSDASYSFINYQASGPFSLTNATVYWELIPSGYPNYSATGTLLSGHYGSYLTVQWDPHPGFANLKCTISNSCATIVQYYSVHIS